MSGSNVPPNLLIVDDDESLRNLLIMAARGRGWHPVAATSGAQACQCLKPGIKAVVLDHGLPDGDGIVTLGRLREMRPDVPVIMLTGLNDAETAVRALKAGADDYLTKPFELERLFSVIQEACRLRRQNSSAAAVEAAGMPVKRGDVLGQSRSPSMRELFQRMEKAA